MKQLGALYLILGTCIAAGLLGLPVATASGHYGLTVIYLLLAWVIMTAGAWCILQVN
jgi:amino acid permease